jgi:hypothetical protein
MAFLAALAALSMVFSLLLWLRNRNSVSSADFNYQALIAWLSVFIFPIPVLPAITSLSLGEFPARSELRAWKARLRRWIFLSGKVASILLMVSCGLLILACNGVPFIPGQLQISGLSWGYAFALRWVLNDQRRRCPECLRLLAHPVRIGRASQTFLGWHGTEFVCVKGHGLLHVPEPPTVWFPRQRWMHLDASWTVLFP